MSWGVKHFCKEHVIALLASFFVGLVVVAPHLIFIQQLGESYKGIYPRSEAELHYLASMKEVADDMDIGNPYVSEFKEEVPSTTFTFGEGLLGLPARFLNVSVPEINLFYKFLFPSVVALLVYFLLFRITQDKKWSLAGMFAILLGNVLFSIPDLKHLLRFELAYADFVKFARPINPQFSSIFFFGYLHVLLSALRQRNPRWFLWLALISGASFYVYFFAYSFIFTLNIIFFGGFLFLKDWDLAKKIFAATIGGLVLAIPVFLHYYAVTHHSDYRVWAENSQIAHSHSPIIGINAVVVALLFLFFVLRKKKFKQDLNMIFMAGLLLTTFAVSNQQVLTGTLIQEGHYHWYFNIPIYLMIIFIIVHEYSLQFSKKFITSFLVVVSLASVYSAVFVQYSSYINQTPQTLKEERYRTVFDWLNNNTPKDSVVLANENLSEFIPVYTRDYVVWSIYAGTYLLPPTRSSFTTDFLIDSQNFSQDIRLFRVDYVLWDKENDPNWRMDDKKSLSLLFDQDGFKIYKVEK